MSQPTIAIIGASGNRSKFGNKAVRAFLKKGYRVFPINPKEETIEGVPVFRSVLDIDEKLDMVSVYLNPGMGMALLEEIAQKGAGELWLNPGAESEELMARARELGLEPIAACSIVGVGMHPRDFED